MKSSNVQKASITLPKEIEKELKKLARQEHRTLSGVIQEASRQYINTRQYEQLQKKLALKAAESNLHTEDEVDDLVHELRRKKKSE